MACACHFSIRWESKPEANWWASCSSAWAQTSQHRASTDRGSGPAADTRNWNEQPVPRDISFWPGGRSALGGVCCENLFFFVMFCFLKTWFGIVSLPLVDVDFFSVGRLFCDCCWKLRNEVCKPGIDGMWDVDELSCLNPDVEIIDVILQGSCKLI